MAALPLLAVPLLALSPAARPAAAQSSTAPSAPAAGWVEPQPFVAHVARLDEALTFIGSSLQAGDRRRLAELRERAPSAAVVAEIQRLLDPYVLAFIDINPEARVKVRPGGARPVLVQHGWTSFLVKVDNRGAVRGVLEVESPNSAPLLHPTWTASRVFRVNDPWAQRDRTLSEGDVANRFAQIEMYRHPPMLPNLSGQPVEYAIVQLYSRDAGAREVRLEFHVGQGTQDLGFRGVLDVLFEVRPAVKVRLRVMDADGAPAMASFIFSDGVQRTPVVTSADGRGLLPADSRLAFAQQDKLGGVDLTDARPKRLVGLYPLPSRRLAETDEYPDFFFQPQIYRADGEHVLLAPGSYEVEYTRGPEYLTRTRRITVPEGVEEHEESFRLERWTDLSALGWHSGDHHVHAAGCSHYQSPEDGVRPEHMWRQLLGEDLDVASVLSWGPGWDNQKRFFTGDEHPLSNGKTVMRYDVEVSGFPSSHAGHLALLGLHEDDYPGTTRIDEWPSWTGPVLGWAHGQGAITGYAHSAYGLEPLTPTTALPNYEMPSMAGIGANEFVVTVAEGLVDFYSLGDTNPTWELNMWYHTLNAGFRARAMGESDFPCVFDERIGIGRTYAKVDGPLSYDGFLAAAKAGRSYVSEGKSHLIDFRADGFELGTGDGELRMATAREVTFTARVSAWLPEEQDSVTGSIVARPDDHNDARPHWTLLRARVGTSRRVPVELVINGRAVARQEIEADGRWQEVAFTHRIERSSWAALRVYPSSHTNPIFLVVGGAPIRASARSAEWLRGAVDRAWEMKAPRIRPEEQAEAAAAYDRARRVYDRIIAESAVE